MNRRLYVLTHGAASDLREIARYTEKTWGAAQRRAYLALLDHAAEDVAQGRGVFKELSEVLPGLRVRAAGRHYLFCLPRPHAPALILAVLHERMDLVSRLADRLRV